MKAYELTYEYVILCYTTIQVARLKRRSPPIARVRSSLFFPLKLSIKITFRGCLFASHNLPPHRLDKVDTLWQLFCCHHKV